MIYGCDSGFSAYASHVVYGKWITIDECVHLEPSLYENYLCEVLPTAEFNGLPPVITRDCQESRYVAYESGSTVPDDFYAGLLEDDDSLSATTCQIIDIKRDSAHLNWYSLYESVYENSSGSALASLAWQSRQVVGRPSFMSPWFTIPSEGKKMFEVFGKIPSWWFIMRVVIIHAGFRDAAQSGLFELLGDASVQIVSVSDDQKTNALYNFGT
ncbi:hypothetical protein N7456_006709 [Penicillium angulare]|uniref:Uncharacterized protein n=1 Tax=Penicillium angulare TaxID=116970 RepID=A0A9W9FIM3_9EURO|nr:hypothetical protein N7456_006709 [Penicillium angulare]